MSANGTFKSFSLLMHRFYVSFKMIIPGESLRTLLTSKCLGDQLVLLVSCHWVSLKMVFLGKLLPANVALKRPDFFVNRRHVLGQVVLPRESVVANVTLPVPPLLLLVGLGQVPAHGLGRSRRDDQVAGGVVGKNAHGLDIDVAPASPASSQDLSSTSSTKSGSASEEIPGKRWHSSSTCPAPSRGCGYDRGWLLLIDVGGHARDGVGQAHAAVFVLAVQCRGTEPALLPGPASTSGFVNLRNVCLKAAHAGEDLVAHLTLERLDDRTGFAATMDDNVDPGVGTPAGPAPWCWGGGLGRGRRGGRGCLQSGGRYEVKPGRVEGGLFWKLNRGSVLPLHSRPVSIRAGGGLGWRGQRGDRVGSRWRPGVAALCDDSLRQGFDVNLGERHGHCRDGRCCSRRRLLLLKLLLSSFSFLGWLWGNDGGGGHLLHLPLVGRVEARARRRRRSRRRHGHRRSLDRGPLLLVRVWSSVDHGSRGRLVGRQDRLPDVDNAARPDELTVRHRHLQITLFSVFSSFCNKDVKSRVTHNSQYFR